MPGRQRAPPGGRQCEEGGSVPGNRLTELKEAHGRWGRAITYWHDTLQIYMGDTAEAETTCCARPQSNSPTRPCPSASLPAVPRTPQLCYTRCLPLCLDDGPYAWRSSSVWVCRSSRNLTIRWCIPSARPHLARGVSIAPTASSSLAIQRPPQYSELNLHQLKINALDVLTIDGMIAPFCEYVI